MEVGGWVGVATRVDDLGGAGAALFALPGVRGDDEPLEAALAA